MEIEWLVGPLPIDDDIGKEMIISGEVSGSRSRTRSEGEWARRLGYERMRKNWRRRLFGSRPSCPSFGSSAVVSKASARVAC